MNHDAEHHCGADFAASCCLAQVKTEVKEFRQAGPFAVTTPFATDTVNVQGQKFDEKSVLSALPLLAEPTAVFRGGVLPSLPYSKSVGVLTFYVNNSRLREGKDQGEGPQELQALTSTARRLAVS